MGNSGDDDRLLTPAELQERHNAFAIRTPELTVLSDQALSEETPEYELFDLRFKVGPAYDIIRHPETKTPITIAIYGDWGAGKTSAMRWLDGLLATWNKEGKAENKIKVHPVWFFPWKYHRREDVWRGLIAEVIIESIKVKNATPARVRDAVKRFGLFLGRSFVHAVANTKLTVQGGAGEAEFDFSFVRDILEEYREAAHPEQNFLNEFESMLETWVSNTLAPDERMVIFIDDLDRCLPEVAIEVLEALKLYLNIPQLIFVVGVDNGVVDKLVHERYKKLGLDESKSGNYLAKMFQVEIPLRPRDDQVEAFLRQQLSEVPSWRELPAEDAVLFENIILTLAVRNPREVKRLINSALMFGAGAKMSDQDGHTDEDAGLTLSQGLQYFFINRVLEKRHSEFLSAYGGRDLDDFFRTWSQMGDDFDDGHARARGVSWRASLDPSVLTIDDLRQKLQGIRLPESFFREIEPRYFRFLPLLADEELYQLLRIPYPSYEMAQRLAAQVESTTPAVTIDDVVADQLGKVKASLTQNDYAIIEDLHCQNANLSSLAGAERLESLQALNLRGTKVSDITPLASLTELERLDLVRTQVIDIAPLAKLNNLIHLDLNGTQVSDITPLAKLTDLTHLDLDGTQVSDIAPLAKLNRLEHLVLTDTKVNDITPLAKLNNLIHLDLNGTQVSDFTPLARLTDLINVNLQDTQLRDVTPLAKLTDLSYLDLDGTQVSDITPLAKLTDLITVDLRGTQVSNIQPLAKLTKLTHLYLQGTQVSDITPLQKLTKLKRLNLQGTQVSDSTPLATLTDLLYLDLDGTQVSDITPLAKLTDLIHLDLQGTQVNDISPLANLTYLKRLDLQSTKVSEVFFLAAILGLEQLNLIDTPVSGDSDQIKHLKQALPNCKISTHRRK